MGQADSLVQELKALRKSGGLTPRAMKSRTALMGVLGADEPKDAVGLLREHIETLETCPEVEALKAALGITGKAAGVEDRRRAFGQKHNLQRSAMINRENQAIEDIAGSLARQAQTAPQQESGLVMRTDDETVIRDADASSSSVTLDGVKVFVPETLKSAISEQIEAKIDSGEFEYTDAWREFLVSDEFLHVVVTDALGIRGTRDITPKKLQASVISEPAEVAEEASPKVEDDEPLSAAALAGMNFRRTVTLGLSRGHRAAYQDADGVWRWK